MKKWENPTVKELGIKFTNEGGGNGGGTSPGNLNHRCPDCHYCFQSNKALADHRNAHPNNPLGGECSGADSSTGVLCMLS